jgi:hypothetical protein
VECEVLRTDKAKVEQKVQEQDKKLLGLEGKNKSLLVTQAFTASSGNTEEAKEKIGKIVREIDKCITLLSK